MTSRSSVMSSHLIVEPVEVAEGLEVFACDGESEAFTQHLVLAAYSQRPANLTLHILVGTGKQTRRLS